jgi:periplasmic protein TonB
MVRRTALTGSLVVHGTIVLGVATCLLRGPSARPGASPRDDVMIEVVAPLAPMPSPPRAPPLLGPAAGPSNERSAAAARTPRPVRGIAARAAVPAARTVETTMRIEPPSRGPGEPGAGAGDGLGEQTGGDGHGGLGPGAGGPLDAAVIVGPLPLPPPAPAASRARPPQLIYPARDREADDAQLFVARLTIDSEGFVVGAHLVRGLGGQRDDQAASAVWRFRYRPALDPDGHPIQATIEQRFLVE